MQRMVSSTPGSSASANPMMNHRMFLAGGDIPVETEEAPAWGVVSAVLVGVDGMVEGGLMRDIAGGGGGGKALATNAV